MQYTRWDETTPRMGDLDDWARRKLDGMEEGVWLPMGLQLKGDVAVAIEDQCLFTPYYSTFYRAVGLAHITSPFNSGELKNKIISMGDECEWSDLQTLISKNKTVWWGNTTWKPVIELLMKEKGGFVPSIVIAITAKEWTDQSLLAFDTICNSPLHRIQWLWWTCRGQVSKFHYIGDKRIYSWNSFVRENCNVELEPVDLVTNESN